jgi:hypothetical protein
MTSYAWFVPHYTLLQIFSFISKRVVRCDFTALGQGGYFFLCSNALNFDRVKN